ncbi:MAG: AraC family transcriptional regulator [Lachnospiraceae bacterium]|nr:AraC family transcriptional regulator [Lachnospiraceae bacterium]
MNYPNDAPYADVFLCNGEADIHDYYYISPRPIQEKSFYYQVNRTGIEGRLPSVFSVERTETSARCCEIFCILGGEGELSYRNRHYHLKENQIVLLLDHEAHAYAADEKNPMGNSWLEFYGAESHRIMQYLIEQHGPVLEGRIFGEICEKVTDIQQRLIMKDTYQPALEIYDILLSLLNYKKEWAGEPVTEVQESFPEVTAYIDSHLGQKIENQELAQICGISLPYFMKRFKNYYGATPQQYVMRRRIVKSKYALIRTGQSIEKIAEVMGFCNTSHFVRCFKHQEKMTPSQYRRAYRL